ncbi:unnamed protein product [Ectocarpus sp. 13 AM-2016]
MPSGYRDVKMNPVVNERLCEIQLHLGDFSVLKSDQHAVYEWARDLKVTSKMRATDLFSTLSREVTEEMIRLARRGWCRTGYCLPELLLASGQYDQAEEGLRQQLSEAENDKQGVEDDGSNESRRALLGVNTARSNLGFVLREQVACEHFNHNAFPGFVERLPDRSYACASSHSVGRDTRFSFCATAWCRNSFIE